MIPQASTPSRTAKVFQGIASRREMYRLFDRHAERPNRCESDATTLYAGEWFEIAAADHDHMLEILPPLWMRGDMFAMREFLIGSVTSVFFTLSIDGRIRHFHGYCDLSGRGSPEAMRAAIMERESRPIRAMTREERLEHIWSATHDDWRGYAGEDWPEAVRGERFIRSGGRRTGASWEKLLADLTTWEISAKLPVQLRHLPDHVAA